MKFNANGIRQRRRERIAKLMQNPASLAPPMDKRSTASTEQRSVSPRIKRRYVSWQIYASLILVVVFGMLLQSDDDWSTSIKDYTREVLTRDYNFVGASAWIEEKIGQFPTLLPTIELLNNKEAVAVFSRPLSGVVVESFSPILTGVIIETGIKEDVHPIGPGGFALLKKAKDLVRWSSFSIVMAKKAAMAFWEIFMFAKMIGYIPIMC